MARNTSKIFATVETYEGLRETTFQYLSDEHPCYMNDGLQKTAIMCLKHGSKPAKTSNTPTTV